MHLIFLLVIVVSHLTPIVRHNKALAMSDKKSLYPRENGALIPNNGVSHC